MNFKGLKILTLSSIILCSLPCVLDAEAQSIRVSLCDIPDSEYFKGTALSEEGSYQMNITGTKNDIMQESYQEFSAITRGVSHRMTSYFPLMIPVVNYHIKPNDDNLGIDFIPSGFMRWVMELSKGRDKWMVSWESSSVSEKNPAYRTTHVDLWRVVKAGKWEIPEVSFKQDVFHAGFSAKNEWRLLGNLSPKIDGSFVKRYLA